MTKLKPETVAMIEKLAEEYCPNRVVEMPNGEPLQIIHSKKTGYIAGATPAWELLDNLTKASESYMNLENDYQAEDTSGLHYHVQYWIEEKARRKSKLEEALHSIQEARKGKL